MVWKGVIIEESLEDKSLLGMVKIVDTEVDKLEEENRIMTFYKIEVTDEFKDKFIQRAIKSVKEGFYLHLVKDKVMYVIFKDKMFKFSKGYPELETARNYGKSVGIPEKQMPFEHLIDHPFD